MTTYDRQAQIERLETLEEIFDARGGRGVDLADEIDKLRALLYPDECECGHSCSHCGEK